MFAELPPDIPEEKFKDLIDELTNRARKIGLYLTGVSFHVDVTNDQPEQEDPTVGPVEEQLPDTEEITDKKHLLVMAFQVGDIAFAPRVQDPETDKFNDEFRKIDSHATYEEFEAIRNKYLKKKDDSSD